MEALSSFTIDELKEICARFNQPTFRAAQLFKWAALGVPFGSMTDIPKSYKEQLQSEFTDLPLKIAQTLVSKDGSEKYLYELTDGKFIEGVFMPHSYGNTLCVSTQAGCRMGCVFCASGLNGLERNLTAGEMAAQVSAINLLKGGTLTDRKITNIVLMGSGEPLDNYDNVIKFLNIITCEQGLNMSRRNISVSTCGLVENIKRLADDGGGVTLSLSLHATTDESRAEIMPIARKYSLHETIEAVKYYFQKTGRRVIFEYSLIKGKNMDFHDAKRLAEISKGLSCHVNLIMLNYVKERDIAGCTKIEADRFLEKLTKLGVSATLRKSFGSDIGGACGQLRAKFGGCKKD